MRGWPAQSRFCVDWGCSDLRKSVIPTQLCHPDRNRSSQSDDLWSGGALRLMRASDAGLATLEGPVSQVRERVVRANLGRANLGQANLGQANLGTETPSQFGLGPLSRDLWPSIPTRFRPLRLPAAHSDGSCSTSSLPAVSPAHTSQDSGADSAIFS